MLHDVVRLADLVVERDVDLVFDVERDVDFVLEVPQVVVVDLDVPPE